MEVAKKIGTHFTLPSDILFTVFHILRQFHPRIWWHYLPQHLEAMIHRYARHYSALLHASEWTLYTSLVTEATVRCMTQLPSLFWCYLFLSTSVHCCSRFSAVRKLSMIYWLYLPQTTFRGRCINLLNFEPFGHILTFVTVLQMKFAPGIRAISASDCRAIS